MCARWTWANCDTKSAWWPKIRCCSARSIAENIAFGQPDATPEEIERAARLAQAHDFIVQMPEGYKTKIGERGVGLSGGQRQRVAIARAILLNPRILILDDSMSAVDAETERLLQTAIRSVMKGRTTVFLSRTASARYNKPTTLLC